MTHGQGGQSPPTQYPSESPSKPEAAKDEARELATTAADRGGEVAHTAVDEAKNVAAHAQHEARDLLREGRAQLESQARDGQRKAAESLHQLAGQLERMAEKTDSPGVASDVARQVSGRTRSVADWLEHREPGDLLDEVRRFARRRPGTFLVGAAVAGAVVGRLTRGVVAQQQESSGDKASSNGQAAAPQPLPATPHVPQPSALLPADAGHPAAAPPLPQPSAPQPGGAGYPAGPGGYTAPQPPGAVPVPGFSAPGQAPR
ncbi:hypothetical protein AB0C38_15640 [Amycolatopsis sp. NPDC048633]|uniref:hypothetical protein n=1 Tax=Amycolatopsis sp. NPDC048633 TaxID=3157095 RepID=UPI0033FE0D25